MNNKFLQILNEIKTLENDLNFIKDKEVKEIVYKKIEQLKEQLKKEL